MCVVVLVHLGDWNDNEGHLLQCNNDRRQPSRKGTDQLAGLDRVRVQKHAYAILLGFVKASLAKETR